MDNRTIYFNYIERQLCLNAQRIKERAKLNILDFNVHAENFYMHFLNKLYGWNLMNLNEIKQNAGGIDLVDEERKIIAQVSSTTTKQKLDDSFSKSKYKEYVGFNFKFISIAEDSSIKEYIIPDNIYNLKFDIEEDIIDINRILRKVLTLSIVEQKELYELVREEFGNEIDILKMDSNLATIINILASEDLNEFEMKYEINEFEIEKKIEYNNLTDAKDIINDYKIYHYKVDEKYNMFDQNGVNKSFIILQIIRNEYIKACHNYKSEYEIFLSVMDKITLRVLKSKNYVEISAEELEVCVGIVVVDAFIRCKIFKNPEGYNYVVT